MAHLEVKVQSCRIHFLLPALCRLGGSNSSHQTLLLQAPLPTEPPHHTPVSPPFKGPTLKSCLPWESCFNQ